MVSSGNYRLFDEVALWCAGTVEELRSLGFTLAEIRELAVLHRANDQRRLDHRLAELLQRSEERIESRIAELTAVRVRIHALKERRAVAETRPTVVPARRA